MTARTAYRIASVIFVFFALGHTVGFLKFRPPTAEGLAVLEAMNNVSFVVNGSEHSYGALYMGFGLYITLYLLFSAFLAWQLGGLVALYPQAITRIGWTFCALQLAGLGLAWAYFGLPPVVASALEAACLGWAAWLANSRTVPGTVQYQNP